MDEGILWIWLQTCLGAGARTDEIFSAFADAREIYEADILEWRLSGVFTSKQIERLLPRRLDGAERVLDFCRKNNISIVTFGSPDYPALLSSLRDFPLVLYVKGSLACLKDRLSVAVVGSREAVSYSISAAHSLCASLARAGAVVVSGGAKGVDSSAHNGALSVGGSTVAVLGCGVDYPYLMDNSAMRSEISRHGALVSEYPPGEPPLPGHFPVRNRLISGMSHGTVVIEAGLKSGSLITAGFAAEQGRDVFAVPGEITSAAYTGTGNLIRDGAKPVFTAADILDEYVWRFPGLIDERKIDRGLPGSSAPPPSPSKAKRPKRSAPPADLPVSADKPPAAPREKKSPPKTLDSDALTVYSFLSWEPVHIDELIERSGLASNRVFLALTELEINGLIKLVSGKRYTIS